MKTEPIWTAWLATALITLAARLGLHLSDLEAVAVASGVGTAALYAARRLVTPTARPRITRTLDLVEKSADVAREVLAELDPPPTANAAAPMHVNFTPGGVVTGGAPDPTRGGATSRVRP